MRSGSGRPFRLLPSSGRCHPCPYPCSYPCPQLGMQRCRCRAAASIAVPCPAGAPTDGSTQLWRPARKGKEKSWPSLQRWGRQLQAPHARQCFIKCRKDPALLQGHTGASCGRAARRGRNFPFACEKRLPSAGLRHRWEPAAVFLCRRAKSLQRLFASLCSPARQCAVLGAEQRCPSAARHRRNDSELSNK